VVAVVLFPAARLFLRVLKRPKELEVFCWVVARLERRRGFEDVVGPVVVVVDPVFLEKRPIVWLLAYLVAW